MLATAVAVTGFTPAALADSSALISGRIVDARDGTPLPGVRVAASFGTAAVSGRSDADGRFTLLGLSSGRAVVSLEAAGFDAPECAYRLLPGGDTHLLFRLSPKSGSPVAACPAAPVGGGEIQDVYVVHE